MRVVQAVTVGQASRQFDARGLEGTVKDFDEEDDETPVTVRLEVPVELLLERLEWNQGTGFECTLGLGSGLGSGLGLGLGLGSGRTLTLTSRLLL